MIIKSILGKKIYQSGQRTMRGALEEGVARGIDFSFADLRKAKLYRASLDGIRAVGATFWGADLEGADIGLADLRKADMRCVNLKDTCLAESDMTGVDMTGAYFSQSIVEGTILDRIRTSCPSFWDLDLCAAASLQGAVFLHKGEVEIAVRRGATQVQGGGSRLVFNGDICLWRGKIFRAGGVAVPPALETALKNLRSAADNMLSVDSLHNAKDPTPKRAHPAKAT